MIKSRFSYTGCRVYLTSIQKEPRIKSCLDCNGLCCAPPRFVRNECSERSDDFWSILVKDIMMFQCENNRPPCFCWRHKETSKNLMININFILLLMALGNSKEWIDTEIKTTGSGNIIIIIRASKTLWVMKSWWRKSKGKKGIQT